MSYRRTWRGLGVVAWLAVSGCAGEDLSVDGGAGTGGAAGTGGQAGASGSAGSAGTGVVTCTDPNKTSCNGQCVDLSKNPVHCGDCERPCQDPEVGTLVSCEDGQCVTKCQKDFAPCSQTCVAVQSDPQNCGGCGKVCDGDKVCSKGECTGDCSSDLKKCGSSCVDIDSDLNNCGDCNKPCSAPTGGTADCTGGKCLLACNDDADNICDGACVDLQTDPKSCGDCGKACAAGDTCAEGHCTTPCQAPGKKVCGGVCIGVDSDPKNCGDCGKACDSGVCSAGKCQPTTTCTPAQMCNGTCTDTTTDPKNCGACGTACFAEGTGLIAPTCAAGACGASCKEDRKACAEPQKNAFYCAPAASTIFCGESVCQVCEAGKQCDTGKCVALVGSSSPPLCPIDQGICTTSTSMTNNGNGPGKPGGTECADLLNSAAHCGICSKSCNVGECIAGKCTVNDNIDCLTNADQVVCADRCTNLSRDPANCGACGKACGDSQTCVDGSCVEFRVPSEPTECVAALGPGFKCCQHPTSNRMMCVATSVSCPPCGSTTSTGN